MKRGSSYLLYLTILVWLVFSFYKYLFSSDYGVVARGDFFLGAVLLTCAFGICVSIEGLWKK